MADKRFEGYQYLLFCERENEVDLFGELANLYLDFEKPRIKESSLYTIKRKADKYILPYFAHCKARDITPKDIVLWQASLPPMSARYFSEIRRILGSIFAFGHRHFDLPNPLEHIPPVRTSVKRPAMQIWSRDEFDRFDSVADDRIYHIFFRLLYFSGCRKGEALALSPSDIDPVRNTVSITKSYTRKCFGDTYSITAPKTAASNRVVSIPESLTAELLSLQKNRDVPFLFGGDHPLSETSVTRHFKEWTHKAKLKPIRIHDLRHSHASYLISSGVSPVAVSKRLGHASVTETLNTYSHVMPQDDEKIMRLLE